MEQSKVITELKKDVSQINSAIEEIRQMLVGPTILGELDTDTYNCFPIANNKDLERVDQMLQDPATRTNIVSFKFSRFFSKLSNLVVVFRQPMLEN